MKIDVRVVGGFQVFDFALFYYVFMISVNVTFQLFLYCFYIGFVKTDLAVGGGFQVCDFDLFYCGLLMIAVPWRGQNVACD